jgi:hypothetical protein
MKNGSEPSHMQHEGHAAGASMHNGGNQAAHARNPWNLVEGWEPVPAQGR